VSIVLFTRPMYVLGGSKLKSTMISELVVCAEQFTVPITPGQIVTITYYTQNCSRKYSFFSLYHSIITSLTYVTRTPQFLGHTPSLSFLFFIYMQSWLFRICRVKLGRKGTRPVVIIGIKNAGSG